MRTSGLVALVQSKTDCNKKSTILFTLTQKLRKSSLEKAMPRDCLSSAKREEWENQSDSRTLNKKRLSFY